MDRFRGYLAVGMVRMDKLLEAWRADVRPEATVELCAMLIRAALKSQGQKIFTDRFVLDFGGEATRRHPDNVDVLVALGDLHLATGFLVQAKGLLEAADALDPKDPRVMQRKAQIARMRRTAELSSKTGDLETLDALTSPLDPPTEPVGKSVPALGSPIMLPRQPRRQPTVHGLGMVEATRTGRKLTVKGVTSPLAPSAKSDSDPPTATSVDLDPDTEGPSTRVDGDAPVTRVNLAPPGGPAGNTLGRESQAGMKPLESEELPTRVGENPLIFAEQAVRRASIAPRASIPDDAPTRAKPAALGPQGAAEQMFAPPRPNARAAETEPIDSAWDELPTQAGIIPGAPNFDLPRSPTSLAAARAPGHAGFGASMPPSVQPLAPQQPIDDAPSAHELPTQVAPLAPLAPLHAKRTLMSEGVAPALSAQPTAFGHPPALSNSPTFDRPPRPQSQASIPEGPPSGEGDDDPPTRALPLSLPPPALAAREKMSSALALPKFADPSSSIEVGDEDLLELETETATAVRTDGSQRPGPGVAMTPAGPAPAGRGGTWSMQVSNAPLAFPPAPDRPAVPDDDDDVPRTHVLNFAEALAAAAVDPRPQQASQQAGQPSQAMISRGQQVGHHGHVPSVPAPTFGAPPPSIRAAQQQPGLPAFGVPPQFNAAPGHAASAGGQGGGFGGFGPPPNQQPNFQPSFPPGAVPYDAAPYDAAPYDAAPYDAAPYDAPYTGSAGPPQGYGIESQQRFEIPQLSGPPSFRPPALSALNEAPDPQYFQGGDFQGGDFQGGDFQHGAPLVGDEPAWVPPPRARPNSRFGLYVALGLACVAVFGVVGYGAYLLVGRASTAAVPVEQRDLPGEVERLLFAANPADLARLDNELRTHEVEGQPEVLLARVRERLLSGLEGNAVAADVTSASDKALAAGVPPEQLHFATAGAKLLAGDAEGSQALVAELAPQGPADAWLALVSGIALERLGDPAAKVQFQSAHSLAPTLQPAAVRLARWLMLNGDREEGMRVVQSMPEGSAQRSALTTWAQIETRLASGALEETALSLSLTTADLPKALHPVFAASGLIQSAKAVADKRLKLGNAGDEGRAETLAAVADADTPAVALLFGRISVARRDEASAIAAADRALTLAPNHPAAIELLGQTAVIAGKLEPLDRVLSKLPPERTLSLRSFSLYEKGDLAGLRALAAVATDETDKSGVVRLRIRRAKGTDALSDAEIATLAKSGEPGADLCAADAALDRGKLDAAREIVSTWPDAKVQPLRAARLLRLLRMEDKPREAEGVAAQAAPSREVLVQRILMAAGDAKDAERALSLVDDRLGEEKPFWQIYLTARKGDTERAQGLLGAARLPSFDTPLSVRLAALFAMAEAGDKEQSGPIFRVLREQFPQNRDLALIKQRLDQAERK